MKPAGDPDHDPEHVAEPEPDWDSGMAMAFGPDEGGADVRISVSLRPRPDQRVTLRGAPAGDQTLATDGEIPEQIGRLQVRGEIGSGGVGQILRAFDPDLGREVAVKILRQQHLGDLELMRRFVEEAQIAGQLQHPGVVPVYEMGLDLRQRPYFAMKVVEGRTLAELLGERDDPSRDVPRFLGVFEKLCETVAYAHSRGVVHRDLKPANVMVGEFGEVQLMDWGFAKVLNAARAAPQPNAVRTVRSDSDADQSMAGAVFGTPAYMAPEQARGSVDALDERADVFTLGAILTEILTGAPPFSGKQALRQSAAGDLGPALQRLRDANADAPLVELAVRCLAPDPGNRLADAGAVAAKLGAYTIAVVERAEQARVEAAASAARLEHERKSRRLVLALAVTGLALVGLAAGVWAWQRDRRAESVRQIEAALRDAVRAESTDDLTAAAVALHQAEALAGAAGEADLLAAAADGLRRVQGEQRRQQTRRLVFDLRAAPLRPPAEDDQGYAQLLAALGVETLDAVATSEWSSDGELVQLVSVALDDWGWRRGAARQLPGAFGVTQLQAADGLDGDQVRAAIRAAIVTDDADALAVIAQSVDAAAMPVRTAILLGRGLAAGGFASRTGSLLEQVDSAQPGDFWLNFELARVNMLGGRPGFRDAERYVRMARALAPYPDWRPTWGPRGRPPSGNRRPDFGRGHEPR